MPPTLGQQSSLRLRISVVIEPDGDVFHAYAPALKGLHVDGATEQEAIENVLEAIEVYLDSLARFGDPLPVGPDLTVHEVPEIPAGAFLHSVTVQWPSLQMSGIS